MRVEDLLRGIIVLSGNDACVVIAEALSPDGTEAGFARYMTQRAQQMGMTNSTFKNSNGWPEEGHLMSVHDLAVLADRIITDFPEFYPLFAEETEFEFDGRAPQQHRTTATRLLSLGIGADGLKTGHTTEAGYGLVGSAKQGERRVIFVISGLDSNAKRAEEASRDRQLVVSPICRKDHRPRRRAHRASRGLDGTRAHGRAGTGRGPGGALCRSFRATRLPAEVVYTGPISAPIVKGQKLAELVLTPDDLPPMRLPLVADRDVGYGGFLVRVKTAAGILAARLIDRPKEMM